MHPVMHHRLSFPVRGVHNARRAVHIPGILYRPVEQIFRDFDVPGGFLGIIPVSGKGPLGDQPCPLNAVAGRGSIGLELVVRLILVALQIRRPVFGEMLRDSPAVVSGPACYMVDDTSCPHPVFLVPGDIRGCQEGFHRMHVGIQASIVIQHGKLRIPGIAGKTFLLVPETKIIQLQRIFQKLLCPRPSRQNRRGCGQNHKRMGIALFVWQNTAVRSQTGIPAAVLFIMQLALQSL